MILLCLEAWSAEPGTTSNAMQGFGREVEGGGRFIRVHDPSTVVKCGDEFWVFSTGFGITSFHSKDCTNWEQGPRVLERQLPWITKEIPAHQNNYLWAPDAIRLHDSYLLYYAASVFGKNTSVIGLATNPTLDQNDSRFHWKDEGMVIRSVATNDFNTIDPAVFQDVNGELWLCFGSYWSGIKLIQLDSKTGKRVKSDSPIYPLAHANAIEAPYLYHHDGKYYLFVNWGQCCKGTNSTYSIHIGRSDSITGPYMDKEGKYLLAGGGSLFLETKGDFIGPGHAGIFSDKGKDWFSCHYYNGTRGGKPTLAILPLRWETNGWPEIIIEK